MPLSTRTNRRILFCGLGCHLGDSDEAVADRAMIEGLRRLGFAVEVLTGFLVDAGPGTDPAACGLSPKLDALLDEVLDRFRPDIVSNHGDGPLSLEIRSRARAKGIAVVFFIDHSSLSDSTPIASVDAVIVPSRFDAEYHRRLSGLKLPLCNIHWGRGIWPFFQPTFVPRGDDERQQLGEDWAFSHRLARIGVTPMADTSIRLCHYGKYAYG